MFTDVDSLTTAVDLITLQLILYIRATVYKDYKKREITILGKINGGYGFMALALKKKTFHVYHDLGLNIVKIWKYTVV